ncbi:lantibiotic dehydratase family protein [Peterkaempfera sp. SMS 1(5)a]|uniref:lantibiotic dehydratase family protein n=1 Tax=Peterkaempfera podocarpi TaxID=3232308 RepID=UPI00366ADA43
MRAALAPRSLPAGGGTRSHPPGDDPALLHKLVRSLHGDPALAAAVELASADLAHLLTLPPPTSAGRRPGDRRRVILALTGYLLRRSHRATPFGLFAGTALIPAGSAAEGSIGTRHRLLLRPAPRWLADLIASLESDPDLPGLATRVRIATVPAVRRLGALYVLPDRSTGGPGRWQVRTRVRSNRLVDAVLALAAEDAAGDRGTGYAALLDLLRTAVPGMAGDELARCLSGLLASRLLATDLLPPAGAADPLGHLVERLEGHPLAERLHELRRELHQASPSLSAGALRRLRGRLGAVHRPEADLVADVLLDTDLRLPHRVVDEVERAASVAWTSTPSRPDRSLAGLHRAVLDRYGLDRPVPLLEFLDPTKSLGLHGTPAPAPDPGPTFSARDRLLTGLALDARAAGRAELRLERSLRRRLAAVSGPVAPPPSVDVFAEIVTASAEAVDRGDFLVVLGSHSGPGPAGSVVGRLAGPLGATAAGLLGGRTHADEAGPLEAEVVFQPPDARAANLVGETGWASHRIDLTPHPPPRTSRDLSLTDLHVIATRHRLLLYSPRLGRQIRPVSYSTLHPQRADAVAGLLLALGRDGAAPWTSWNWGAAEKLSWLPRVRVGRAVLASARWRLPPTCCTSPRWPPTRSGARHSSSGGGCTRYPTSSSPVRGAGGCHWIWRIRCMRRCCSGSAAATVSPRSPNLPAVWRPGEAWAGRPGPAGRTRRSLSSPCIPAAHRGPKPHPDRPALRSPTVCSCPEALGCVRA